MKSYPSNTGLKNILFICVHRFDATLQTSENTVTTLFMQRLSTE